MIYVIGHQSPDLDSVAAAICYSELKNKQFPEENYISATAGEINKETEYALEKFGFDKPALLEDASGKNLILVDHNEFSQAVDGAENAEILEVLDHHKVNFKYDSPILFRSLPWGATCTIIAEEYEQAGLEIDAETAGLMLSAILVDTVITKSPTCLDKDKEVIEKLVGIAGIKDWKEFGMDLFKVRSSVQDSTALDIIKGDFKDFETSSGKIGIGQVETVDLSEFDNRQEELLQELESLKNSDGYHTTVLFITDIIKEGSRFLVATSDERKVEEALGVKPENGVVYLDGVISRKKQVAPKFTSTFN
jgi:manganese-dependent inorganic pyrophosphatase